MNPHPFLTESGRALRDKELVDAENAVRENVVYLAGAILVIGTLAASFKTLELERKKFASEKEKEWKEKVQEAYSEWAGLFLSATRIGIEIVDSRKAKDEPRKIKAQQIFEDYNLKIEIITFRILMLERRKNVLSAFKAINADKYPHYPIPDEAIKEKFWEFAKKDRDIIGHFHGLIKWRLTTFFDWLSAPDDSEFLLPSKQGYLDFVEQKYKAYIES